MSSAGDESGLTNMLGYGDADSSRGDISYFNESEGASGRSPSVCGAHQAVSTPRRQSHRPGPRRHSPQVSTPQPSLTMDENSPDCTIAFTPGKTKLNSQSLLALQRKFGGQPALEGCRSPSPRGLRPSDSSRNARDGAAADPSSALLKKGPSILKIATPTVVGQAGTPRASLIPRPTGSATAAFKRKILVTFANSPKTNKNAASSTKESYSEEAFAVDADPQTPCNSSRRALAGHTPGLIPRDYSESMASPEQSISTSEQSGSDEREDQLSNLVSSFGGGAPMSPEMTTPATCESKHSIQNDADIFCGDVSVIGKPPAAPPQPGSTPFARRPDSDSSGPDEGLNQSGRTSANDSATPSTLFYSSSEGGRSASRSVIFDTAASPDFGNDVVSADLSPHRYSLTTAAAAPSQPASLFDMPEMLMLSRRNASYSPDISIKDASVLSIDSSPLDFSQRIEPDFLKSIGINEGAIDPAESHRPALDYNTEFVTVPSRQMDVHPALQRQKATAPSASFSCVGSPVNTAPRLSRAGRGRAAREPVAASDPTPDPHPMVTAVEVCAAPVSPAAHVSIDHQIEITTKAVATIYTETFNREVSLSRPGLRRAQALDPSIMLSGGRLSETEKNKSIPFMMSDSTISMRADKPNKIQVLDKTIYIQAQREEHSSGLPSADEPTRPVAPVPETARSLLESKSRINIDKVCKEVIQELYSADDSVLAPPPIFTDLSEVNASLGLNDLLECNAVTETPNSPHIIRPRTVDGNAGRRLQSTPSTCSSGWSLGTTAASRVPSYSGSARRGGSSMFAREYDEDAPVYGDEDWASGKEHYPKSVSQLTKKKSNDLDESFVSQNTMTTVAIDDDLYSNHTQADDNIAQLCLTSRVWQQGIRGSKVHDRPPEDVKEIMLYGRVGYTTAVSISFRNKRSRGTVLQARAILHRFEPTDSSSTNCIAPANTFLAISQSSDESGAVDVAPDDKVNITVEFSPFQAGIFSGVLKIRSKKKAFVLLLRGEATSPSPDCECSTSDDQQVLAPVDAPCSLEDSIQPQWGENLVECNMVSDSRRQSLKTWLRQKLDSDASSSAREKLKDTYDRARYVRLLYSNSDSDRNESCKFSTSQNSKSATILCANFSGEGNDRAAEHGIYFRRESVDFGITSPGSILRLKIELCNSTDKEVCLHLGDPTLPFIVLHNEISVPAHSFVRIPVRFVPVYKGKFTSILYGQILGTDDEVVTIQFSGTAL